jgi:hypothetical protein
VLLLSDSPDDIQWHPAFYAAAGIELKENIEELELIPEYNLSKEPIRIDLLIIKDNKKAGMIKNEIGHIMKRYNVIEYKSPKDGMSIDDFYKTVGYACLYKGYGATVNQIPLQELTVSLFRASHPRELFAALEREGHEIEEKYPGIYYVTNKLPIPAQIVVTSELSKETHSCLRILSDNAEKEDVERFLEQAKGMQSPGERNNIDSVLQVSVSANHDLYEDMRRDAVMCQALEELMKDVIDERVDSAVNAAVDNTKNETKLTDIRNIMDSFGISAEQAMDALKIPSNKKVFYLSKL